MDTSKAKTWLSPGEMLCVGSCLKLVVFNDYGELVHKDGSEVCTTPEPEHTSPRAIWGEKAVPMFVIPGRTEDEQLWHYDRGEPSLLGDLVFNAIMITIAVSFIVGAYLLWSNRG
jgi:hypothetical protein